MRSRRTHAFGILPILTLVAERIIYKPKWFVKEDIQLFHGRKLGFYVLLVAPVDYVRSWAAW
jgi:hypothetical protein